MSMQTLLNRAIAIKAKSFAEIIGVKAAEVAKPAKAGPVAPATIEEMMAILPECVVGCRDATGKLTAGLVAQVINGKEYFVRPFVRITKPVAQWILTNYAGTNRRQVKSQVDRIAEDMDGDRWEYMGNTLGLMSLNGFVVDGADWKITGACNGFHTLRGFLKSKLSEIWMTVYIGIPSKSASKADVNMVRRSYDVVGMHHLFDRFKGMTAVDGVPLASELGDKELAFFDQRLSEALRVLACVFANKKSVKDSEKLREFQLDELVAKYGETLADLTVKVFVIDKRSTFVKGDKAVTGGLKNQIQLSHAIALWFLAAAEKDGESIAINPEVSNFVLSFLHTLADEGDVDLSKQAVVLRQTLLKWKLSGSKSAKDQNIKWNALKGSFSSYVTGEPLTVEQLAKTTGESRVWFETDFDPVPTEPVAENEGDEEAIKELDE